jgi:hypothetical protein
MTPTTPCLPTADLMSHDLLKWTAQSVTSDR